MYPMYLLALLTCCPVLLVSGQCDIDPDSSATWPQWPAIITDQAGDFILPQGEDNNRRITLQEDTIVFLSCGYNGTFDYDTSWKEGPVFAKCKSGDNYEVWTEDSPGDPLSLGFADLGCEAQPLDSDLVVGLCGPEDKGTEIRLGFDTWPGEAGVESVTLTVCYDMETSVNIWSRHNLWDEIEARDHGNDSPPFSPDDYFDFDVNHFYSMDQQRKTIAELVGSQELADHYVQDFDSDIYLARGHLSPNADFIFYSWMDSTYHFVNVAPQWQAFNGGNWMYFEIGVRDFAVARSLDLVVYTGTHEVCQLEDIDGKMVDIYLYDQDRLPVPRFYWKIIHDPINAVGVAVVGVNNIHLKSLPADYDLCTKLEDHPILDNVYHQDDLSKGAIWACRVEDLVAAIPNVPDLSPMDLLQ